jgi:hypothetical protein
VRQAIEQRVENDRRAVERLCALKAEPYLDAEMVGVIDHEHRLAPEADRLEMLRHPDGVFFAANPRNQHVVRGGRAEWPRE